MVSVVPRARGTRGRMAERGVSGNRLQSNRWVGRVHEESRGWAGENGQGACSTRAVKDVPSPSYKGSMEPPNTTSWINTDEECAAKVRRYSTIVTLGLIVFCNVILLFGVWVSGVNLDELVRSPDLFNAKEDVCLRLTWERISGATDPVRVCSEWINLADPTGQPHHLPKDIAVRQGPDGQYYFDRRVGADFRLFGLALFVAAVVLFGLWARRYLVSRYRLQLGVGGSRGSSGLQ